MGGYGLAQSQPCDQVIQSYFSAEGRMLARLQYAYFTASCTGRRATVRGPKRALALALRHPLCLEWTQQPCRWLAVQTQRRPRRPLLQ